MKIGVDEVKHVARLAELAVSGDEMERLAGELERIVELVEQLGDDDAGLEAVVVGPDKVALRPDVPGPVPLSIGVAEIAPDFRDDFFSVPRLGGMVEE